MKELKPVKKLETEYNVPDMFKKTAMFKEGTMGHFFIGHHGKAKVKNAYQDLSKDD